MEKTRHQDRIEGIRMAAEKPLMDMAAEPGWTPEEQNQLRVLARRRGHIAVSSLRSQTHVESPERGPERNLEVLANDAIRIIESNPQAMHFGVDAIGNVLNEDRGRTMGVESYNFDSQQNKMAKGRLFEFLDDDSLYVGDGLGDTLYKPRWCKFDKDGGSYIALRLQFRPVETNRFCTDDRRGVHMTLAVRYSKDQLASENPDIVQLLEEQNQEFLIKLLSRCAEKYIPDYFNFVMGLMRAARSAS